MHRTVQNVNRQRYIGMQITNFEFRSEDRKKYIVFSHDSINKAIRVMDSGCIGICVCTNKREEVVGIITDGDLRRAILNGINLKDEVSSIMNNEFISLSPNYIREDLFDIFHDGIVRHVLILQDKKLVDIVMHEEIISIVENERELTLNAKVLIMAGGKGTRLAPFTDILPKPLIPINGKPAVSIIMDKFKQYGIEHFSISLHEKSSMVKAYYSEENNSYDIHYIDECKPLGTAGALSLFNAKLPFFLINCDAIIDTNYHSILDYHKKENNEITIVVSTKSYEIPYGVCNIGNNGKLLNIDEKPSYDLLVNTGMYVLNPSIINLVSSNKYLDMTDLILMAQQENLSIGLYPIAENSWRDIGQWSDFNKTVEAFNSSNL